MKQLELSTRVYSWVDETAHILGGHAQKITISLAALIAEGDYAAVLRNDVVADLIGTTSVETVSGV